MAESVKQDTLKRLAVLKKFNLIPGEYAIAGSAPMAIRGLRKMNDIDLIVSYKQWQILSKKYSPVFDQLTYIALPGNIDVLSSVTYPNPDPQAPTIKEGIKTAEIIDGLPYITLEYMLWYKERSGREKDQHDIELIKGWFRDQAK